jgi:predicted RNase H-like nuclease
MRVAMNFESAKQDFAACFSLETPASRIFQVAGVDGCRAGWIVAVTSVITESKRTNQPHTFELKTFFVARDFKEVLSKSNDCELVCIDIPIGLSDGEEPRACDVAARETLGGKRASSVFPAPIRPCLSVKDYKTASDISFEHSGKKLTRQSFALLAKIRQVDDLMTPALQHRVREIHPEISFWALNNQEAIQQNKKTVPGRAQRHRLLYQIFANMDNILSGAPAVGFAMDDAFDALVAAWTAGQTVLGKDRQLPENPGIGLDAGSKCRYDEENFGERSFGINDGFYNIPS